MAQQLAQENRYWHHHQQRLKIMMEIQKALMKERKLLAKQQEHQLLEHL
jgi:hypothetical protein